MSLDFLYTAVSWVLLRWHQLFTAMGTSPGSGINWSLSIVFLVITARLLLFRLFIKQVHYQRHMQAMQPKIRQIQEKYQNDHHTMQQKILKLQQEEGLNTLSGCLPMLLQIPIFISLYHVLRHLANSVNMPIGSGNPKLTLYTFTADQTHSAATAKLLGAPLAASLRDSTDKIVHLGGDLSTTRIVTVALVLISALATYWAQILARRGQPTEPAGTAATVHQLMLYFIPISVLISGLIFPLGVLLYWLTSNIWTLGQQAYINTFHPHVPPPGPGVMDHPGPSGPDDDQGAGPTSTPPRTPQAGQRPNRPGQANPSRSRKAKKRRRRATRATPV